MASGSIDSVNAPAAAAHASGSHTASGSIDSVNPPGAAAANASRRLGSILLDRRRAYFTNGFGSRRNETTATARTKDDDFVSVSFWMAEPPGISCFSLDNRPQEFTVLPHVVGADGRFVLLHARFSNYGMDEYFMYKAGSGDSPSLECIPLPDDEDDIEGIALRRVSEFGIVPHDHGDHYLLAALCDDPDALCDDPDAPADYHLRIYSSQTKAWGHRKLLNPCPGVRRIIPDKVIALGEGSLGWVDFSCGLVACDLLQEPPVLRFIPLPEPLPGNKDKVEAWPPIPGAAVRSFRDLACFNGVLKFFEMERHKTEQPNDPTEKDVLYDSDLITSLKRCNGVDEKNPKSKDCWRAVTWSRKVRSNCWRKECILSGDDILLEETKHSTLVSRLRGNACGKLTLSDLYLASPTLSTDGDNIIYLMSVAEPGDQSGWLVSVDLGNRTVKAAVACSSKEYDAFRPCTLSQYLNMTPGTEVSACHKMVQGSFPSGSFTLKEWSHARRRHRPPPRRQVNLPPLCVKTIPILKELHSVRLMAWKNKRAQNEPHSIVQNGHVSEVQPVQTNLALQHENSQPLWQQPSPSNKPLGEIRPCKAAQPCLNKRAGTYLTHSEQLLAHNTFPYDTQSDYGTYRQQLQQPPSFEELPASASCEQTRLPPRQLTSGLIS